MEKSKIIIILMQMYGILVFHFVNEIKLPDNLSVFSTKPLTLRRKPSDLRGFRNADNHSTFFGTVITQLFFEALNLLNKDR